MDLFEFANQEEDRDQEDSPQAEIYTVSEVTFEIKQLLLQHFTSKNPIIIEGEVSNYRGKNSAGHMYFNIKDDHAILPCVFFRYSNQKCKVDFKEGTLVQVQGKIDLYEKGGRYQFIVEELKEKGKGSLYEEFLKTKARLEKEGLFDEKHKKPIPGFSTRIGVVTSSTGSVIKDIIHVIQHRAPVVEIKIFPAKVQGDGSAQEIAAQIQFAQDFDLDVLIVARGGGSIEDLWSFNEEVVARAIFDSRVPVISAVGHQTDFTIADFVADIRAATPSQAAEFVVPNLAEVRLQVDQVFGQMIREVSHQLEKNIQRLRRFSESSVMKDPRTPLRNRMQFVDDLNSRMIERTKYLLPIPKAHLEAVTKNLLQIQLNQLAKKKQKWDQYAQALRVLNPHNVLGRGYSIVKTKDNKVVSKTSQVKIKEQVQVIVSNGEFQCVVEKI